MNPPTKVAIVLAALRWGNLEGLRFARVAWPSYRLCLVPTCIRGTRSGVTLPAPDNDTILPLCDDCWHQAQAAARAKPRPKVEPLERGTTLAPNGGGSR